VIYKLIISGKQNHALFVTRRTIEIINMQIITTGKKEEGRKGERGEKGEGEQETDHSYECGEKAGIRVHMPILPRGYLKALLGCNLGNMSGPWEKT